MLQCRPCNLVLDPRQDSGIEDSPKWWSHDRLTSHFESLVPMCQTEETCYGRSRSILTTRQTIKEGKTEGSFGSLHEK
ncbi:hypothetical protein NC653_028391 [Populus alba x Populus x berolinensis]|uniref:Uncharacterized protein n=1 Tax=Populus alba x Populus x berolinensis TaxID=444605 RepID=A0AAD6Q839_9ROSI|nr:hypothetical protein NC653_028391 [Populus alba x Populus x berolinensis]